MNGVNILNEFEVATEHVFNWTAFWIGLLIGALIGLICAIIFGCTESDWSAFGFGCACFIPAIGILVACLSAWVIAPKPIAWETHYEVSITEEVNMKEFMETYEILETRGSIYTVKEKN